jgi:hypothetical protein
VGLNCHAPLMNGVWLPAVFAPRVTVSSLLTLLQTQVASHGQDRFDEPPISGPTTVGFTPLQPPPVTVLSTFSTLAALTENEWLAVGLVAGSSPG